jgi:hypothetical protein
MKAEISLAPKNSLILVVDPVTGDIPNSMARQLVASTGSCVAVGTISAADGETTIVLTDDKRSLGSDTEMMLAFEGTIDTPRTELSICSVDLEPILSIPVSTNHVGVEIWVNHEQEPSRICVLVI